MREDLAGYVLERPARRPAGPASMWVWVVLRTVSVTGSVRGRVTHRATLARRKRTSRLQLRLVGRLTTAGQPTPEAPPALRCPAHRAERPTLPRELATRAVPGRAGAGDGPRGCLRGIRAGSRVHPGEASRDPVLARIQGELPRPPQGPGRRHRRGGRARACSSGSGPGTTPWPPPRRSPIPPCRADAISAEQKRNLGYGLYKALQEHGGWLVDPAGWRPYRGVDAALRPVDRGRGTVDDDADQAAHALSAPAPRRPAMGLPGTPRPHPRGEVGVRVHPNSRGSVDPPILLRRGGGFEPAAAHAPVRYRWRPRNSSGRWDTLPQ